MRVPLAFLRRPVADPVPPIEPAAVAARTAPMPRVVWIELTSRCPYDCPFCSRKTLRGHGANMPLALYRRIVAELDAPDILRLNYSGESTHHPQVVEAVALAAATGAWVELVAVPAALAGERLEALVRAGLNRLTVSLHTLDAAQFAALYGFGDLARLLANLRHAAALRSRVTHPFVLDLAFVATAATLPQLPRIAALATELSLPVLAVHPVIRRADIAQPFAEELDATGALAPGFRAALEAAIAAVRAAHPGLALQVSTPEVGAVAPLALTAEPAPWPGPLPDGARLHGCDQDPFETLHILADGKVVTCEVRDAQVVGDLAASSLADVWHGPAMREFRASFLAARDAACRGCAYKQAHRAGPLSPRVGARAHAAQRLHGWHAPDDAVVWSRRDAALVLARPRGATALALRGLLPPGAQGANALTIDVDGARAAVVGNAGTEALAVAERIPLPAAGRDAAQVLVELHTAEVLRPARLGGADVRALGFALLAAEIV